MWNTSLSQQVLIEFNIQPRWWENFIPSQFNSHYVDRYTLNKHVIQLFQKYAERELQDWLLYKAIRADFRQFREEHFNELDYSTWMYVREYCYTHEFWLKETSATGMLQAINSDFYEDWFMKQIRWVEKRYNRLSDKMMKRKLHLIIFAQQQQLNQSVPAIASSAVASTTQSAVALVIEPAVAPASQSAIASAIEPAVAPASQSAVASVIEPAIASVNQSSQQVPLIIQNAAPVPIQQAASHPTEQAPDQAPPQAPDQATLEKAAPVKATPEKAAPKKATPKKTAPINKNAVSANQTLYVSASHLSTVSVIVKSVNIQPIIQHLIACLLITISTLPARGIGWVETKGMSDVYEMGLIHCLFIKLKRFQCWYTKCS